MKKLSLLSLAVLLLPLSAFAAYNDVSLTSDTILTINGITINVTGTTANIASITVDSTSFTVSLEAGSTLKVNAPNANDLAALPAISSAFYTCTATDATLEYKDVTVTQTITITPSAAACSAGRSSSSGGTSISGGGGAVAAVVIAPVTIPTIASLQAQLNALLVQLAALQSNPAAVKVSIPSNLSAGSKGKSVKDLQIFLNGHGFIIASYGAGSPGHETENLGNLTVQAVKKFQEKYGIAAPGVPGYGRVGPKTRAKINELSK